ncbi:MAG: hypothetical protein ACAH17_03510 [Candidatus Paceibacterota bacterium]
MARKWPLKSVLYVDGAYSAREGREAMAFFGNFVREVEYNGHLNVNYGLYDTLLVSYSRFQEFRNLMLQRPPDERSNILASMHVSHNEAFYADSNGAVTKWKIDDE